MHLLTHKDLFLWCIWLGKRQWGFIGLGHSQHTRDGFHTGKPYPQVQYVVHNTQVLPLLHEMFVVVLSCPNILGQCSVSWAVFSFAYWFLCPRSG